VSRLSSASIILAMLAGMTLARPPTAQADRASVVPIESDLGSWDHPTITYAVTLQDAAIDDALATVASAVESWNTALAAAPDEGLHHFSLAPAPTGEKPDIDVLVSAKRRGDWDGSTTLAVAPDGRIEHVMLKVSDPGFGASPNPSSARTTVAHELGHALGLGHASTDDDLMYASAEGLFAPSECDIRAVAIVEAWYLTDAQQFVRPRPQRVRCGVG
jgi:hypothetical protein